MKNKYFRRLNNDSYTMIWNEIHCGDNLNILSGFLAKGVKFDLVLTDPPYNLGKDFGNDTDNLSDNDFLDGLGKRLEISSKLLSDTGAMICFASHLYVTKIQLILEKHLSYRRLMIWHYKNGMSRQTNSPVTEFEPFLWMTKSSNNWTYNLDDVRVPYKSERVKNPCYKKNKNGEKIAWNPNPRGAKRGDVWEYPCLSGKNFEKERTEHQTQKPLSLTLDLIKSFCPKIGDKFTGTILDPYCGSGTTLVACEILNKSGHDIKYIGIELEQKWVDVTNNRISEINQKYIL